MTGKAYVQQEEIVDESADDGVDEALSPEERK